MGGGSGEMNINFLREPGPEQGACGWSCSVTTLLTILIRDPIALLHLPRRSQEPEFPQRVVSVGSGLCLRCEHQNQQGPAGK